MNCKWISVEDMLPDQMGNKEQFCEEILFVHRYDSHEPKFGVYDSKNNEFLWYAGYDDIAYAAEDVICWMPIPKF